MNSRIFNAPIDLFIEEYIFENYPELRPHQLISLHRMNQLSLQAVTDPAILRITPAGMVSKIKIYNTLSARQIDSLFGFKLEAEYPVSKKESGLLDKFWDEFNEYKKDKEPGEEYELLKNWAEDLELDQYFYLQDDPANRKAAQEPMAILESIEADPFSDGGLTSEEDAEMQKFIAANSGQQLNVVIMIHMVEALKEFSALSDEEIKSVAIEIGMLGRTGIDPVKSAYRVSTFPKKNFTGHKLLAFMYAALAVTMPEVLKELMMPFEKEYALAKVFLKL